MTAVIALPILALTGTAQAYVLVSNAAHLSDWYIGTIYVTASLCYFLVHWAEPYVEELSHMGFVKYSLLTMWVWISLKNDVFSHSIELSLAGMVPLGTISITVIVIEVMAHLQRRAIAILIRLNHEKDN